MVSTVRHEQRTKLNWSEIYIVKIGESDSKYITKTDRLPRSILDQFLLGD